MMKESHCTLANFSLLTLYEAFFSVIEAIEMRMRHGLSLGREDYCVKAWVGRCVQESKQ